MTQSIPLYPTTGRLPGWVAALWSRWTYTRALYLALSFPLGLVYLVALVIGLGLGGILAWSVPGLMLLIGVVLGARWAGDLEAALTRHLAGIPIQRPPTWYERDVPLREQARQILGDPSTWLGIAYLAGRLVQGLVALVVLAVGGALSFALIAAPVILAVEGEVAFGTETIDSALGAWALVLPGLICLFVLIHVVNLLAWLYGQWARLLLGSRARTTPAPPPTADTAVPAPVSDAYPQLTTLTAREREVLLLIARGYSNAEIAEAFVISEGTVKTHVKRLLAKLDVRDRTQAAVFAFESGFVTPETASEPEPA